MKLDLKKPQFEMIYKIARDHYLTDKHMKKDILYSQEDIKTLIINNIKEIYEIENNSIPYTINTNPDTMIFTIISWLFGKFHSPLFNTYNCENILLILEEIFNIEIVEKEKIIEGVKAKDNFYISLYKFIESLKKEFIDFEIDLNKFKIKFKLNISHKVKVGEEWKNNNERIRNLVKNYNWPDDKVMTILLNDEKVRKEMEEKYRKLFYKFEVRF